MAKDWRGGGSMICTPVGRAEPPQAPLLDSPLLASLFGNPCIGVLLYGNFKMYTSYEGNHIKMYIEIHIKS
uniref:Uncharacterized protein n=1 Tax=Arundo donax TaxID=35708 RepID=A0A0A9FRM9_ARUDO